MDLYQYFSPHFNPRLLKTAPRLQELDELKQAAIELKKAIKRADLRVKQSGDISTNTLDFSELKLTMEHATALLTSLSNSHPGDKKETIEKIIKERVNSPGWENWVRLASERLEFLNER